MRHPAVIIAMAAMAAFLVWANVRSTEDRFGFFISFSSYGNHIQRGWPWVWYGSWASEPLWDWKYIAADVLFCAGMCFCAGVVAHVWWRSFAALKTRASGYGVAARVASAVCFIGLCVSERTVYVPGDFCRGYGFPFVAAISEGVFPIGVLADLALAGLVLNAVAKRFVLSSTS
jgi:hypothetical protein